MRHINFEEYVKENKRKYRQIRLLLRSESKAPRIKSPQRDLKARQELACMTKRKWELWIESGKLEEIGERRYKIKAQ